MADDKANKDQSSLVGDISKRINDFYRRTFFTPPDADIELRNMGMRASDIVKAQRIGLSKEIPRQCA